MRIAVVNGPNLNLLGTREPAIYGTDTLSDIEQRVRTIARELSVDVEWSQHNGEGEMIDAIQSLGNAANGAIVNAGAYSHTSLAIRDAFAAVALPYVEVHLTNIFAREPERRHSTLAAGAVALICGFGAQGYELALRGIVGTLSRRG